MRFSAILAVLLFSATAYAQEEPAISDKFQISTPSSYAYTHIELPPANILIKRAIMTDYKSLRGIEVVVTDYDQESGKAELKRADGKNFFRFYPVITADVKDALQARELLAL